MERVQEEKTSIRQAVALLIGARRRRVWQLAGVRGLWLGLTLLILFFYLDAVAHLDGRLRLGLSMVAGLVVVGTVLLTAWWLNRTICMEKMLARLIERDHPEIGNDLTNAIEFEERIGLPSQTFSRVLMGRGIARAVKSFDLLEDLESLKPPTLRKESFALASVLGVWLVSTVLFSGWVLAEVPRFVFPFGDHPPYSPTRFVVEPAGAVVDYGKNLTVHVATQGRVPKAISLVVKDPSEGVISRIPMFQSQDGKFFQSIEDIRAPLVYWASIERGRSKYYQVTLCKDPRIEAVRVRYRYPGYARLAERAVLLSADRSELKGYRDTEVTMTVASNRPLESGEVAIGDSSYPCRGRGNNTVEAVFPLKGEGPFSVAVTDVEGNTCTEPFAGAVTIVPDDRPLVSIVSPGMNSLATPTAQVPIVIEAQDDLGIKDVSLFRSHNESDDARKRLFLSKTAETFVSVAETLDLADLGVRPGDVIDYYATATDSWPEAPQTVASAAFNLQIISEDEYAQMMRNQMTAKDLRLKYDNIIQQLTELIEAQEQLEGETTALLDAMTRNSDGSASEALRAQLGELERRQNELREQTDALAQKLEEEAGSAPVFDIEKDYKKFLGTFAQNLTQASGHMAASEQKMQEGAAKSDGRLACVSQAVVQQRKALEALGTQTEEMRKKIQQANRDIERVINLLADVEMFKALYLAQQQVTRHTQTFREIEDPDFDTKIRLKELGERETSIQEDLERLAQQFREHAEEIKAEYPVVAEDANRIADEIAERKITELMGAGADCLNRGSGVCGYPNVLEALKQMEEMIRFCESTGGRGCRNCQLRLAIQMMLNPGNTLGQLAQGIGAGMGTGVTGAFGSGAAGYAGGQSNLAIFGGDTFGQNVVRDSAMIAGARRVEAQAVNMQSRRDSLAGNIEELTPQSKRDAEFEVEGDSRMMSEYRPLIEAYFRRLAEEQ
ncbi:MAG: hypothetical protein JSW27_15395 [Phycisphaerales bacterium]|nr:MAG: hypothetical protein JSW27_15395 [Phycisphaerales bacterium]